MLNVSSNILINYADYIRAIKLMELTQGTAEAITEAIFDYLSKSSLDLFRLAGGACDGASVMTGPLTGVVAHIKLKVPLFLATHCVAHCLSLAAVDACANSNLVSHFQSLLNEIYSFFSRSTVHTQQLKEVENVINDPQLKLTRATETRWLSVKHSEPTLSRRPD